MKREISVWVDPRSVRDMANYPQGYNAIIRNQSNGRDVKATLVIEEPPKKCEITEFDFEILVMDFIGMLDGRQVKNAMEAKDAWKQKLFGNKDKNEAN